jgi:hypothetical protein
MIDDTIPGAVRMQFLTQLCPKRFSQLCRVSVFEYLCSSSLGLNEGEQVGIDHIGLRRDHAVWVILVGLQYAVLEELG